MGLAAIPLGTFDLYVTLGRGGMAEVWQGIHRTANIPVAVKVLTEPNASDPGYVRQFRAEVRSVAALHHPHIVHVLDHGTISAEAADASDGRLKEGAPWLAMEMAKDGTLTRRCGKMSWFEIRHVLLTLLGALGHAHARGVLHLDLKPDNVLLGGLEPGLKLSDFGVAQFVDRGSGEEARLAVCGTPSYMAPEQAQGRWRDFGPWTDLYSLGCVSWTLVTRLPPYGKRRGREAMEAHLVRPVPELPPSTGAPAPFRAWVARLLAKHPGERFRTAADAAWALRAIPDELFVNAGNPVQLDVLEESNDDELSDEDTFRVSASGESDEPVRGDAPAVWSTAPPMAADWRTVEAESAGLPVGPGTVVLRPLPLTGRDAERDLLWRGLSHVTATQRAHAIVLEGERGIGKTRLAEWLGELAEETGAAHVLRTAHAPNAGPLHGIVPMLSRALRCGDLQLTQAKRQIWRMLSAQGATSQELADGLASLILAEADGPALPAAERFHLIASALAHLATDRPVVVVLDDAHNSEETLAFVDHVLAVRPELPLLLLVVVREGGAGPGPAKVLASLVQRPAVTRIALGPLTPEQGLHLIARVLHLEPGLARDIVRLSAGNPLHIVQILALFAIRGRFEEGDAGLRLSREDRLTMPQTQEEIWSARIDELLNATGVPEDALWVAAALGREVLGVEWVTACEHLGVEPSVTLREAMFNHGLARSRSLESGQTWGFQHPSLAETLLVRASRAGRLREVHRACARGISARGGKLSAERVAAHLLTAGEVAAAGYALVDAIEERLVLGPRRTVERLAAELDLVLHQTKALPSDRRRGVVMFARAWAIRGQPGFLDRAEAVTRACATEGWPALGARTLLLRAEHHREHQAWGAALDAAKAAAVLAREAGSLALQCRAALEQARAQAHFDAATADAVLAEATANADPSVAGELWEERGRLAVLRNDLVAAQNHLRRAQDAYEGARMRMPLAGVLALAGDVARRQGELDQAERVQRRAVRLLDSIGPNLSPRVRANLALVLMSQGRYAEAGELLVQAAAMLEAIGENQLALQVRVCHVACAAGCDDWSTWDAWASTLTRAPILREPGIHPDGAWAAGLAGDLAARAGQPARARGMWDLAAAQWTLLGDDGAAELARQKAARVAP